MKCLKFLILIAFVGMTSISIQAQTPEVLKTESSDPDFEAPLDDIVENDLIQERRLLDYDIMREADIFWKKRIWRVLDIREKMNLHFAYPERPFITILIQAATNGDLVAYQNEKFTEAFTSEEILSQISTVDTVVTFDPETYEEIITPVVNDLNPEDIKRYRMKEMWFVNEETAQLGVRTLGIAPLRDVTDDNGNFLYEQPMFWIYYPDCREFLSRETAYMVGNDAAPISWEDILEMRYYSSYVFKESNVLDLRLKDYLSGVDMLLEADKIKNEIFNYEHDLWSY